MERLGGREDPVLGEIVLDGGARPPRRGCLPLSCCGPASLRPSLASSLVAAVIDPTCAVLQPNGGGPLRWKGRDPRSFRAGRWRAHGTVGRTGRRTRRWLRWMPAEVGAVTRVDVPLGRQVMVVSDLLLTPTATPSSTAVSSRAGPGPRHLGRARDPDHRRQPVRPHRHRQLLRPSAKAALDAHPALAQALSRFLDEDERRVIRQTGDHESGAVNGTTPGTRPTALAELGVEQLGPVDLHLRTATGPGWYGSSRASIPTPRGAAASETNPTRPPTPNPAIGGPTRRDAAGATWSPATEEGAPWLVGLNRLSDPSARSRFVVSRTLYRRLGPHAWWLLVPFVVALPAPGGGDPVGPRPSWCGIARHGPFATPIRPTSATRSWWPFWSPWSCLAVLAAVLGLLSRRLWSALGGGALDAASQRQRPTTPPVTPAASWSEQRLRRARSRRPPSSPSSPISAWASTPTWAPAPR